MSKTKKAPKFDAQKFLAGQSNARPDPRTIEEAEALGVEDIKRIGAKRWWELKTIAARASETHRALELLVQTLAVARDLADRLRGQHSHDCGCNYCLYDDDHEQIMEEDIPGIWWALEHAHARLDGVVVVQEPLAPDLTPRDAFRELARQSDDLWPESR